MVIWGQHVPNKLKQHLGHSVLLFFGPQVQELHEEEAQWVNYDEDELFVKMQLAESIFDSLLKDTVNVLTLIQDKRAKSDTISSVLPW